MGFELVYCWKCTKRLTEKDFADGKAFRIGIQTTCTGCADELLAPLSPQQRDAILNPPSSMEAPLRYDTPRPAKPVSPREVQAVGRRASPAGRKGPSMALVAGAVAIGAVLVALVLVGMKKHVPSSHPPTHAPDAIVKPAPPPAPTPAVDTRTPSLGKDSGFSVEPARDAAARAALQKARDHQKAKPDDLGTIAQLYEQAIWDCEKTPLADEAKRGHADALARLQAKIAPSVAALAGEVQPAVDREEYQKALDQLAEARKRDTSGEWGRAVDRKVKEVLDAAEGNFIRLKAKVASARQRDDKEEIQRHKDAIKTWGIPRYIEELERLLSGPAS